MQFLCDLCRLLQDAAFGFIFLVMKFDRLVETAISSAEFLRDDSELPEKLAFSSIGGMCASEPEALEADFFCRKGMNLVFPF